MTWYWLPLLLILIPIIFAVVPRYRGRRRKVVPQKVYQESMTRRHTPVRISETKVELANWELEFANLDVQFALKGFAPMENSYVSPEVLKYCYVHDRARFDIFMAHNNRIDMRNLGYSALLPSAQKKYGEYDAKEHSKYY